MKKKLKWYSVLLLYPDYIAETFGQETFYAWVQGRTTEEAIIKAREQAVSINSGYPESHNDFYPLLVLLGRRRGQRIRETE